MLWKLVLEQEKKILKFCRRLLEGATYHVDVLLVELIVECAVDVLEFVLHVSDGGQLVPAQHHRLLPFLKLVICEVLIGHKF